MRDTVNFLDYVSEPIRAKRESLGLWVVLFLLVFTGIRLGAQEGNLEGRALSAGLTP